MPPTSLVLATGNPHKVAELRAILGSAPSALAIRSFTDFPAISFREPEEIGVTFEANAAIKGLSYSAQLAAHGITDALVLADDSGIEIDALKLADGTPRPGVISSHYATDGRETGISRAERDEANNARVQRELEAVPFEKRTARFVCTIVVVKGARVKSEGEMRKAKARSEPDARILHTTRGTFEGRIGIPPRIPSGANGFGYDPLFLVAPALTNTGAELAPDEKNRLSHRASAARQMATWLRTAFATA